MSESPDADPATGEATSDGAEAENPPASQSEEEQRVPLSRLNQVIAAGHRSNETVTRLTRELEEERQRGRDAPSAAPPRQFTRQQLSAAVESGEITQTEADAVIERQMEERIMTRQAATARETAGVDAQQRELGAYQSAVPELMLDDSPTFKQVAQQLAYLQTVLGYPENTATRLAAVQAVLGPLHSLRSSVAVTTAPDTRGEGGSGAGTGGASERKPDRRTELTTEQTTDYGELIRQGVYKDWDEVHANIAESKERKAGRIAI